MSQSSVEHENITFESGYDELKDIVARLNAEDVSVHEMFEGFRRGKGLEQALRGYLTEREGELTEIEQGKNLPEFKIVAPSADDGSASATDNGFSLDDVDFGTAPTSPSASAPASAGIGDDDIPF
jgi:exodeoxyribonuclease VII small subunit